MYSGELEEVRKGFIMSKVSVRNRSTVKFLPGRRKFLCVTVTDLFPEAHLQWTEGVTLRKDGLGSSRRSQDYDECRSTPLYTARTHLDRSHDFVPIHIYSDILDVITPKSHKRNDLLPNLWSFGFYW